MMTRSSVQAVILHIGDGEDSVPTRFEINSRVTLMPGKQGSHAREAKKHGGNSVEGVYKARVLKFRLSPSSTVVSQVQVQHAYMYRQVVDLDPEVERPQGSANYLYLSQYVDWVDAQSLMGIITVVHAEVGEPYRQGRTDKELLSESLFFYNAFYYPRTGNAQYGRLKPIPLPSFDDPLWPLPDMATTESFRAKMRSDFLTSMKPNTGSRQTHLQWFMPITVMVDLFSCAQSMQKTSTFFVFKNVTQELMSSLMDSSWDTRHTTWADTIRCQVDWATLAFKYHIGRCILYANFQFNHHRKLPGSQWQSIDQAGIIDIILVACEYGNWQGDIEVGRDWLLSNVRMEINITLGPDCPDEYSFVIVENDDQIHKVNRRNERKLTAGDILPPKKLRVVPLE